MPRSGHHKGKHMTSRALKSTTASILAISLLQPYPAMAQIRALDTRFAQHKAVPGGDSRIYLAQMTAETCFVAGQVDLERCDIGMLRAELDGLMQNGLAEAADRPAEDPATAALTLEDRIGLLSAAIEAAEREAAAAEADRLAQAEAEAAAQAEADKAAQAEAEAAAQAEADRAAQSEAEAAAQAEADKAAQAEAEAAAQAEADRAAQAEAEAAAQAEADRAAQAEALATAAQEAEASALKDAQIIAEQTEAQDLAAVASTTDGETPAPAAEVSTEVVTAEDTRSSDQEFTTPVNRSAEAPRAESNGLSNLEKAGLLALGALAVGAIMQNGQRVAATSGDRVIVEDNSGRFQVLKDDDALIRQPGSTVETRRFDDGSTTTSVTRDDGSRVVTIRDASGRVLRRSVVDTLGRETLLIDDIAQVAPVNTSTLPPAPQRQFTAGDRTDRDALRAALRAAELRDLGRSFSLRQVREIVEVRELAPEISLEDITFRSGSAAIQPSEAEQLREIGLLMRQMIRDDPREIFLVEGYTDAVGRAEMNLLLSDRRAESVALALTEYFDVPPENMVVQGYGERFLKIPTLEAERLNRRVAVRRITSLIAPR
jgi:outer membrane protein OmpA-like peptidoglycan-associated protein